MERQAPADHRPRRFVGTVTPENQAMSIINTNVMSLNSQRNLATNSASLHFNAGTIDASAIMMSVRTSGNTTADLTVGGRRRHLTSGARPDLAVGRDEVDLEVSHGPPPSRSMRGAVRPATHRRRRTARRRAPGWPARRRGGPTPDSVGVEDRVRR